MEIVLWDSKGEALGIFSPGYGDSSPYSSQGVDTGEPWYAISTRLRWEKKIASALRQHHISAYLPLVHECHRWSDRSKIVKVPLFPGYVFVRTDGSSEKRLCILQINGVLGFAGRQKDGTEVGEAEIENLRLLLGRGITVRPHPFLQAGQRARIGSGGLEGVEGIVLPAQDGKKLVISVELIQRSVAIACEGYEVVPIEH